MSDDEFTELVEFTNSPTAKRIAALIDQVARLTDANDDMRDLLREIYNLTQIGPGHHPQMPARALELIAILIEDKTPPP
jgi:hypothetical protein